MLQLNHKPNVQRKLDSMVIRSSKGRLSKRRRVLASAALVVTGMTFQALGFLDGCNDRLVNLTYLVDPCGTFLANCNPGDFQARNSPLGDPCIDPTCTVAGQCQPDPANPDTPPLGTLFNLCD